jgi:DNA-directed RNA polymerase specialized sigma24 family protein
MPIRHARSVGGRETRKPPVDLLLQSLPAEQREIIIATYFHRRTTPEAARLLGLAPDVAKTLVYQAMSDLSAMVTIATSPRVPTHRAD